jgi:DNA ligase-1
MTAFATLASAFSALETTRSRTQMVRTVADLATSLGRREIQPAIYLLQGHIGPQFDAPQFGISEKLTTRAVAAWAGVTADQVEKRYRKLGDHGAVAEQLALSSNTRPSRSAKHARAERPLTIAEVLAALTSLAKRAGSGSVQAKIDALVALLRRASPLEARYLLRIPMGRLRLGVGDATIMDGLAAARGDRAVRATIERAYNLCSDLGLVARTLFTASGPRALARFKVEVGRPVKMQFAERAPSIDAIVRRMGTCAVEPKYDGFRCQVHKNGARVRIFSRNQEDNTAMFPDIARAVAKQIDARRAIFEGEALAYDDATGTFQPFQVTVQRKRVHGIAAAEAAYPLRLNVFDLLYAESTDLTSERYRARRARLKKLVRRGTGLALAPSLVSSDAREITRYFEAQIAEGLEGIVAKRLDAPYEAGKRNFNWIKFKRAYHGQLADTLDLVIVGYFAGRGARARLGIGAVLCAVYDKKRDRFKTVAKVAAGMSEADWIALRKRLEKDRIPHAAARLDTRIKAPYWVEPRIVVEVFADEITRSPVHTAGTGRGDGSSGLGLRFPRIVRGVRQDRSAEDATTEAEIERLYSLQRRAKGHPAARR